MKLKNPFRRDPAAVPPKAPSRWRQWFKRQGKSTAGHHDKLSEAVVTPHPNSEMIGLVFGMSWHQHLMRETVASVAASTAARCGANYAFYRPKVRSISTYGMAQIAARDKKKFARLVPAAVVFAESVKDKETAAILLLDLRDANGEGYLFLCMAMRGEPVPDREFLGSEEECIELLRKWTNATPQGVHVLLDLHPGSLHSVLQNRYASNDDYSFTDQAIGLHLDLKPISLFPFKRWHVVFLGSMFLLYVSADFGAKLYEEKIAAEQKSTTHAAMVSNYIKARSEAYAQSYHDFWLTGFLSAYSILSDSPVIRQGWKFNQAICSVPERTCRLLWSREYGTYTDFLNGLEPQNVQVDAADYTKVTETRTWPAHPIERPALDQLPGERVFIQRNGDRKDTLLLSGFNRFSTDAMAVLVPWTGQGVPPGENVLSSVWRIDAGLDLMLDLSKSTHLGPEFSVQMITFTNTDGQLNVQIEGNVYVRKL